MEIQRQHPDQHSRAVVCRVHDGLVRVTPFVERTSLTNASILIPWVTLRQVPVEVEIVCISEHPISLH